MHYRNLGASGFRVPVLSFSTGTFGGQGPPFSAWGRSGIEEALRLVDIAGSSRQRLLASVDSALRRLGTDHIDLLQLHAFDAFTPIEEVLSARRSHHVA